jgi:hypothetical protein
MPLLSCLLPYAFLALANDALSGASRLHPMHDAVASFGAAVHKDALYVAGGHVGETHVHSLENLSGALARYPLADLGSVEVLPAQSRLQSVALVSTGAELYRIGGLSARNATGLDDEDLWSVAEVARLDESSGLWSPALALPSPRSSHDAIVLAERIYVFGGWTLGAGEPEWCREGLVLDLGSTPPEWSTIEQPFERRALVVASCKGRIYCIGGLTPDGAMSTKVDVYDVAGQQWSAGPDLPCKGFGISATGLQDELYVAGSDGFLYALSADGSAWEPRSKLAMGRMFARLVELSDTTLALVGGVAEGRHVALLEELALPSAPEPSHEPSIVRMDLAFPGAARQRMASFVSADQLYIFGGNRNAEAHRFEPGDFTDEGWKVDLLHGTLTPLAALPEARQSACAVLGSQDQPCAFIAGGIVNRGAGMRSLDEVLAYDIEGDRFKAVGRLGAPVSQFGLALQRGRLFAFGGLIYADDGSSRATAAVSSWHPEGRDVGAGFREAGFALDEPRRAFAGGFLGERYVVLGGMGDEAEVVDGALAVNLADNKTEPFPAPEFTRVSGKLVELGGKLYLVGGASERGGNGLEPDRTIEVYEPERAAWRVLVEDLPLEDARHVQALAWRERLLVFTAARAGRLDLLWVSP